MTPPQMALIEQRFDTQEIADISGAIRKEIAKLALCQKIKPGDSVAITAGSRGIHRIAEMTRTVVGELQALGARPFIFPAMGSHGGATAQGQLDLLDGYGITEAAMGCPIKSGMDVVYLGDARDGYPLYVDRFAGEADHIVVVNRIKPHTKFQGPFESGLMKMMAIGMGKHKGAAYYHRAAVRLTFEKIIETVGRDILSRCPILFGLGIVENALDRTCRLEAVPAEQIPEAEKALLVCARKKMARLPFDEIDILIVDEMGKNISGTGMDTHVTGRNRDILGNFTTTPKIKRIFVRDLSPETEGNANGIGLADFTTSRLVEKIHRKKTYTNALTALSPEKAAIPMHFDSDREALQACLDTIGDMDPKKVRIVHIQNTLQLSRISVSSAFSSELIQNDALRPMGDWEEMPFDVRENIVSPFTPKQGNQQKTR